MNWMKREFERARQRAQQLPSFARPVVSPESIKRLMEASPDIRPEVIRQASEQVEYLTAMAKTWIVNGNVDHGAMLQNLCIAFGFQQTEIERLSVENKNTRAEVRYLRDEIRKCRDYFEAKNYDPEVLAAFEALLR